MMLRHKVRRVVPKLVVGGWSEWGSRSGAIATRPSGMINPVEFEDETHSDGTSRLTPCPPNGVKPSDSYKTSNVEFVP
jgi:hypothetical protein